MSILHFVLGTLVGSFLGVVILRLGDGKSGIVAGRSECPQCGRKLGAFELIPVLSYVFQSGKCRGCGKKIGIFYPLIEIVTGVVFVLGLIYSSTLPENTYWDLVLGLLVLISFFDLRYKVLPDAFSYVGMGLVVFGWILGYGTGVSGSVVGALIFAVFFGMQIWISKETWLGWGDLFLGIFLGMLLGYPQTLLGLFLGYLLGAVTGVSLIAGGYMDRKSQIPFAPFLCLGALVALLWGDAIITYYWNCLGLGMCDYGI